MRFHQGAGTLVVPPGVALFHFIEEPTKVSVIGAHKIGYNEVALLGPLLTPAVKFG